MAAVDETTGFELPKVDPYSTSALLPFGNSPLIQAQILSGRTLASGEDVKETVELTFDVKSPYNFLPGDSVGIFPNNPDVEVQEILKALRLVDVADATMRITVKEGLKKKLPQYIPPVTTPKILLTSVLEIRGVLKKAFLRALAEYAEEPSEKRRLLELASQEGSSEYEEFMLKQGVTLSDVFSAFPSCRPKLALLVEHLPRLMPRAYSIASSPLSSQTHVKIVFNVVHTRNGKHGVCSSWLKRMFDELLTDVTLKFERLNVDDSKDPQSSSYLPLFFRKPSKFRVPDDPKVPLIAIGPGTGIAPFLGFFEHFKLSEDSSLELRGTRMVYFGCRYFDRDAIFKEEMEEFERLGLITSYRACYSRDKLESNSPKYVQDLLYEDKNSIYDLLESGALVFICGDALNMAKDVQAVVLKIIKEVSGMTDEDAQQKLQKLENDGKLVKDVWR